MLAKCWRRIDGRVLLVSQSSIARKMKDLQAAGEIRRIGAPKNGHWEVTNFTVDR